MYIPFLYILFIAEATLVFFVISLILAVIAYRLTSKKPAQTIAAEPTNIVNLGSSYIEHLETEIMKNNAQTEIETRIEHDTSTTQGPDDTTEGKHSKFLKMRNLFLASERAAAEHTDNDIQFWQHIYDGMHNVLEHYKTVIYEATTVTEEKVKHSKEITEKVFYIETQGKKIDGEVNRLKDIIYSQENTLSDLIKALKKAEDAHPEFRESDLISALKDQVVNFERQLRDSKTCMEILEMENNRLLEEVHKNDAHKRDSTDSENISVDVQNMREMLEKQEAQIARLVETIDTLKIDAEQAERLKSTLGEFAHSSREMMGCITILEEENERLLSAADHTSSGEELLTLKIQIKKLEEENIKKDVAYAKLQEEFSSMEKEYLAMYNAIHGNNG